MRPLALVAVLLALLAGAAAAAPAPHVIDRDPVFSPGGKAIAFVRWDGTGTGRVMVMRRDGRNLHAATPVQPQPYGLTWSPDGRSLAYTSGNDIWRVDLATGQPLDLTHDAYDDWQPDWSPDGKQIAYDRFQTCFRCTALHVISAVDGSNNRDLTPTGGTARRPRWSPDGTKIALSLSSPLVVDTNGNPVVPGFGGSFVSWFPDSQRLVYLGRGGVNVYDLATKAATVLGTALREYPVVSRDGTLIAGTGFRNRLSIITADGKPVATIAAASMNSNAASWGADNRIAFVHTDNCGIDVAWGNGTHVHRLTRVC